MRRAELEALDEVSALIVVLQLDGRVVWWNRAYAQLTGRDRDMLPVPDFLDLVAEPERDRVAQAFEGLERDAGVTLEYLLKSPSGEPHWTAWTARVRDTPGRRPLIICTGIDRTAEHAALEELRASEERLRDFIMGSVDAVLWFDEELRISVFNRAAERLWGFRADEVVGSTIHRLIPSDQLPLAERVLSQFATSDERSLHVNETMDVRGQRADGSEFHGDLVLVKAPWRGRWSFAVTMRDVTARVRSERQQRFFSELGRVVTSSASSEEIIDVTARLAVTNLADCCVIDLLEGDRLERIASVHADPSRADLAAALREVHVDRARPHPMCVALADREPFFLPAVDDWILEHMAQTPRHLELLRAIEPRSLLAVPLVAGDKLVGALLLFSTKLREYEEEMQPFAVELGRRVGLALENARLYRELQTAIRARDDVLGIVAHDLRSPLGAILVAAQGVLPTCHDDERAVRLIEIIRRASDRMSALIDDLLDIARMEAGQLRLKRRRCDAREIVDDVVIGLGAQAEAGGVTLSVHVPKDPVELHADRLRAVQVLTNLVGNAVKFTPRGGHVDVIVRAEVERALFVVRDTGPGIPAEAKKHLFEPFWQRRRSTGEGAGLGLAIARGLVIAHGGDIGVESQVGQGSSFWFRLPLAQRMSAEASGAAAPG